MSTHGGGPFVREAGAGDGVVCIHANASSSAQWRGLSAQLASRFLVLAADCYGSGRSADWSSDRVISLADEVRFMEPVLERAGRPLTLVGHSYGAAVALVAALQDPGRVRAMALFEPVLFAVVDQDSPPPNAADGIREVVVAAGSALDAGDRDTAARLFIDYWMGEGSWDRTPDERKPATAASVANVRRWGHALFTEPTPLSAFRALDIPVLYMVGGRSRPSALGVAQLLTSVLPDVEVVTFESLGHMGPITHPEPVNAAIAGFLERIGADRR